MQKNPLKVTKVHVILVGLVIGIILGAGMFFGLIKPTNAQIEEKTSEYEGLKQKADALQQNQQKLAQAKKDRDLKRVLFARYENRYFRVAPERAFLSMRRRTEAMILLWKEQTGNLSRVLTRFIRQCGLRLLSPLQVPAPPTDPMMIDPNLIQIPIQGVQVMGDFQKINRFLKILDRAPRLIQVNNLTLSGQSPQLTAQMDLVVYIMPRDWDKAETVVGVTSDTTGGAYGAPGGYPGGAYPGGAYPGAPPAYPGGGASQGAPGASQGAPGGASQGAPGGS